MSTKSMQGLLACSTMLPTLGIVVVGLRFYARSTQKAKLKIDDWLQIPSLLLFLGAAISTIYGVKHHALGYPTPRRPSTDPPPSLILAEKLWFVIQILQIAALAIIKIAALFFYQRLFVISGVTNSILNIIIWILIVIIIFWAVGFIGFYIGGCGSHVAAYWSGWIGFLDFCLESVHFEEAYAISDSILDTFILILPQPSIWALRIKLSRKIGISCVFFFALIGYGASIARLVVFVRLASGVLDTESSQFQDVQSIYSQSVWFSALEIGLQLFALNLPSIWFLIRHISMGSIFKYLRSAVFLNRHYQRSNASRMKTYNEVLDDERSSN